MKQLYVLLLFFSISSISQESWGDFTGKEKAFLYHQARRVEILKPELFHLFEFTDSIPYINDTLPDFGYVEKQIVQDPSLLKLHSDQINRKSDGMISDLCVRYALWELDQILQYRNSTADEDKHLKEKLKVFEKYVLEKVPQSAIRTLNNGDYVLIKTIQGYYAPSLTVSDKMAAIVNAGYSQIDQMLILNAIMGAQEKYVHMRSLEILEALGGKLKSSVDYFSAIGDGSNWADITGGFNTPYTIGLPDEKGLFSFIIEEVFDEEKEKNNLSVKSIERKQHTTSSNFETVVHIDIFGYHPERQTTIAIQKGGNSYVLYGKNEHRLVSPDSSYGEGTTYWRLMYNLEHYYIARIKEDLYGKRGYEYQIDLTEKNIEKTKIQIKETEYKLDVLRHTPEGKPKIKKKKNKKKNLGMSAQDGAGHPTSALSKLDKKKNIQQNRLIQLNGLLDGQKRLLNQLKEDMENAYINLVKWETKLDLMKKNIGYIMMEYEVDNHLYTFKDGATFNYLTQDFTFPVDRSEEVFQVYHISFGEKVFDEKIDENFAHLHVSQKVKNEKFLLNRVVRDGSNRLISQSDSIQIMEIFHHLSKKDISAEINVIAGGVLGQNENSFFRDSTQRIQPYDKPSKSNNGLILYKGDLTSQVNLSVTAYDDPMIPENFEIYRSSYEKAKLSNSELNEVDYYCGVRAKRSAEIWIALLKELAQKWVHEPADRKVVLSKLKKLKPKSVNFLDSSFLVKVPKISA